MGSLGGESGCVVPDDYYSSGREVTPSPETAPTAPSAPRPLSALERARLGLPIVFDGIIVDVPNRARMKAAMEARGMTPAQRLVADAERLGIKLVNRGGRLEAVENRDVDPYAGLDLMERLEGFEAEVLALIDPPR